MNDDNQGGFELLHPQDGAKVLKGFVAQGTIGGDVFSVSGRLVSSQVPQVTYPVSVKLSTSSWAMIFVGLCVNHQYRLEILDQEGDIIATSNITVQSSGAGTVMWYPGDGEEVGPELWPYGETTELDNVPLECVKVCDAADCSGTTYGGVIEYRESGFWTAKFPASGQIPAGSYWVKVGKKADCSDAAVNQVDVS